MRESRRIGEARRPRTTIRESRRIGEARRPRTTMESEGMEYQFQLVVVR